MARFGLPMTPMIIILCGILIALSVPFRAIVRGHLMSVSRTTARPLRFFCDYATLLCLVCFSVLWL